MDRSVTLQDLFGKFAYGEFDDGGSILSCMACALADPPFLCMCVEVRSGHYITLPIAIYQIRPLRRVEPEILGMQNFFS